MKSADVRRKTLLTAMGETISYKFLIVATGARVMKLIIHFLTSLLAFKFQMSIFVGNL